MNEEELREIEARWRACEAGCDIRALTKEVRRLRAACYRCPGWDLLIAHVVGIGPTSSDGSITTVDGGVRPLCDLDEDHNIEERNDG